MRSCLGRLQEQGDLVSGEEKAPSCENACVEEGYSMGSFLDWFVCEHIPSALQGRGRISYHLCVVSLLSSTVTKD